MSSGLAPLSDDEHVGTRTVGAVVGAMLLVSGCSTDEEPEAKAKAPSEAPTTSTSASPSPSDDEPATDALPPVEDKVSLAALMREDFSGGRIRVQREVLANDAYTRSEVTYPSGSVTVSGVLLRPRGKGPFPAVVLNHGHIEPSIYVTGQGLMREQDFLARAGFVVLHTDYRGHAASDPASDQSIETRLGYTRDTINAVQSVKRLRYVDPDKVAMLGRSMGGGVTLNALVVKPGLVRAAVVFAPVSSDFVDNFNRWTVAERPEAAAATYRRYGTPRQQPAFYRGLSARTYFDRITEPVLIHHGTDDESCPVRWSHATQRLLERAGVDSRLDIYQGEHHAFGPQWPLSMERTVRFLRRQLRG
jgi:dipeptidyl aminopeptidase/acylaminoacyl peptidase